MRIIGHIDHPRMKITVFKMDTRLAVKFETGFLEQTYKFGQQNGLEALPEILQLIDGDFQAAVEKEFTQMQAVHMGGLDRHFPPNVFDEFDNIL